MDLITIGNFVHSCTQMGYNILEEGEFQYVEEGKGEVIVLLHGLFGALSNFKDLIDYFKKDYQIVVPILPLYTLPRKETTVEGLVNYIEKFIEFKGYEQASFLGNSLGGHVGLVYAVKRPERVKSLILTGSSGLFEKAFGDTFPKRGSYDYIKTKTEETFYDPAVATKELVDEVFEIVNNREKALRVLTMAKSAVRHNMAEEVCKITAPTFLIWGKNDIITPPFVGEEFCKLIPNAQLVFIDQCGHAPMMERPQAFNKHLEQFLLNLYS